MVDVGVKLAVDEGNGVEAEVKAPVAGEIAHGTLLARVIEVR